VSHLLYREIELTFCQCFYERTPDLEKPIFVQQLGWRSKISTGKSACALKTLSSGLFPQPAKELDQIFGSSAQTRVSVPREFFRRLLGD